MFKIKYNSGIWIGFDETGNETFTEEFNNPLEAIAYSLGYPAFSINGLIE